MTIVAATQIQTCGIASDALQRRGAADNREPFPRRRRYARLYVVPQFLYERMCIVTFSHRASVHCHRFQIKERKIIIKRGFPGGDGL
jgi:hypothetical protein